MQHNFERTMRLNSYIQCFIINFALQLGFTIKEGTMVTATYTVIERSDSEKYVINRIMSSHGYYGIQGTHEVVYTNYPTYSHLINKLCLTLMLSLVM